MDLTGTSGPDVLDDSDESGRLTGGSGDDLLFGRGGNDTLNGGAGNDTLDGGAGADTMSGGAGDDVYLVDFAPSGAAGDLIIESASGGNDTVRTGVIGYTLGVNLESLVYTGSGDFTGIGNLLNNTITGGDGSDRLDGGAGNDTLVGGAGDDIYMVDSLLDVISEQAGQGIDTVGTTLSSYTLGAHVENLTRAPTSSAFTGVGNELDNMLAGSGGNDTLSGNDGNDMLDGGAGADVLVGGAGDDIYVVDNAGDKVFESGGQGLDTVRTTLARYVLATEVEALVFQGTGSFTGIGNDGDNTITGGAGNDTLIGGLGDDVLIGGGGNDTYRVDSAGDVISEEAGGGTDTVRTSLAVMTLTDNLENLVYEGGQAFAGTGNMLDNLITGGGRDDILDGGAGNDTLVGGAGNDTLIGGAGTDRLMGGAGNDVYIIDDALDQILEAASGGMDEIRTGLSSYSLLATQSRTIENLTYLGTGGFAGTGNQGDNVLTGGVGSNTLDGREGNDTLIGGAADDTLIGGAGNDVLEVGDGTNVVTGGSGFDMAAYATASQAVTATLDGNNTRLVHGGITDVLSDIEGVRGSGFADAFFGGAGNDRFEGLGGDDTFIGGAGSDTISGGAGNDIVDYGSSADGIRVNLGAGTRVLAGVTVAAGTAQDGLGGTDTLSSVEAVIGSSYGDVIVAGTGGATLYGFGGADTLIGNSGVDTFYGGDGQDTFVFCRGGGRDVIADFTRGLDTIDLTGYGYPSFGSVGIAESGGDSIITLANGSQITVKGVTGLGPSDFQLSNWTSVYDTDANDTINSSPGGEYLVGGYGDDTYVYEAGLDGSDIISDVFGTNVLVIKNSAQSGGVDISRITWMGSVLVIELTDGNSITITTHGMDSIRVENGTNDETLYGLKDDNVLNGGSGNDVLVGDDGNDTLVGGSGNDTLIGNRVFNSVDVPFTSDGRDVADYRADIGGVSVNLATGTALDGWGGTDTLIAIDQVYGSAFNDVIIGQDDRDYIDGGKGNDSIYGGVGDDYLDGGRGNDTLYGGAGDDEIIGNFGNDTIDGGDGFDTAIYYPTPYYNGVSVNLDTGIAYDSQGGTDILISIEGVVGSDSADIMVGSSRNEAFSGAFGDDTILAGGGNDTLDGSYGSDTLDGGDGIDLLYCDGRINLSTETQVLGGKSVAAGTALTASGTDVISSIEWVIAGMGSDFIAGGAGNETLEGGWGHDTLIGGAGNDWLIGDDRYHDWLTGNGYDEFVFATGSGQDVITDFQRGFDLINLAGYGYASFSDLSITESAGDSIITLAGGSQITVQGVSGLNAHDFKFAPPPPISGSAGNDTLVGTADSDILQGGAGNDTYVYTLGSGGSDTIDDSGGADVLTIRSGPGAPYVSDWLERGDNVVLLLSDHNSITIRNGSVETVNWVDTASSVTQSLRFATTATSGNDILFGADAPYTNGDILSGFGGNDVLVGAAGTDTLYGGLGNDTLFGGDGYDFLYGDDYGQTGADVLFGGNDGDRLYGLGGDDMLNGGSGDDTVDGGEGWDIASYADAASGVTVWLANGDGQAYGGAGYDVLVGVEAVIGSDFNDYLLSRSTNTSKIVFEGGAGNDTIFGTANNRQDCVSYESSATGVTVHLGPYRVSLDAPYSPYGTALDGFGGTDTLNNIDYVFGSRYDDLLVGGTLTVSSGGTTGTTTLHGGRGNDTLIANTGPTYAGYEGDGLHGVKVNLSGSAVVLGGSTVAAGTAIDEFGDTDTVAGIKNVLGSDYADFLYAADSGGTLIGGGGNDTLIGNTGSDFFAWSPDSADPNSVDVIQNFGDGTDHIWLAGVGMDWATLQTHITSAGGNSTIDLSSSGWGKIVVQGISSLDAGDFSGVYGLPLS